jgi:hypothetical protein
MSTKLFVHIDRLVLTNVDPRERDSVSRALREALSAGLERPDIAERLGRMGHVSTVSALPVRMKAKAAPRTLGRAAGESIARSLLK